MTSQLGDHSRDHLELAGLYALQALPPAEVSAFAAHMATCEECRSEVDTLGPIIGSFVSWPTDIVRPSPSVWDRLAHRIAEETGQPPLIRTATPHREPEWEAVAPGISIKLLATDLENDRVSLLVRLAPGAAYPPHHHAGVEELHLLDGELWIDEKQLHPGDYSRSEPGTADRRVWSETGCTCVLLTSTRDLLG